MLGVHKAAREGPPKSVAFGLPSRYRASAVSQLRRYVALQVLRKWRARMYQEVIDFWFTELEPKQWWNKSDALDSMIQNRFGSLLNKAKIGELFQWRNTALGSLAEIIILDQFSRTIYRDKPESFSCDPMALVLAQSAISQGLDNELSEAQRAFLYMPFMHSESTVIHVEAIKLFEALGNKNNVDFEYRHKAIIDRFGRYPHRNEILGRQSTTEETEFLKQPNSGF